jgi:hypothetical protein
VDSRLIKITLFLVVALVITLTATALVAHALVSRLDYELIKQQIASRVFASTGYELRINGPLELPYSLLPTVVLKDFVLTNPNFNGAKNLLEAEELRIKFAVLPLIRGKILVYESSISSVDLNLEVNEEGRANWVSSENPRRISLPAHLTIHEVDSHNIRLSYNNLLTGVAFDGRIEELNLQTPIFGDQIHMESRLELAGIPVEITGRLGSTEEILSGSAFPLDLHIDIHDVDIEVNGQIDKIENGEINDFLLRFSAQGHDLREIERLFDVTVPETKSFTVVSILSILDGTLSASNIFIDIGWLDSELELAGDIADIRNLAGINIATRLSGNELSDISSSIGIASLPRTDSYNLSSTVQGDWPSISISAAQISLRRNEITLEASGSLSNITKLDGLNVLLNVRGQNLAELSQIVGQEMPPTLTYNFSGRLEGSWPTISVSAARAKVTRENLAMDLTGSIGNLTDLSDINLGITARGSDLSRVAELSPFEPPATDRFSIEGQLSGSPLALTTTNMEAILERGRHRLALSGDVNKMPEFSGVNLDVTATGTDLSEFNTDGGLDLPPTQSYRLTAALVGDAEALIAQDIVIEASGPGARLELRGSIGSLHDFHDIDLAMLMTIDSLSNLNPFLGVSLPKSELIEVGGRLKGSMPDLSLDKFILRSGESLIMGSAGLLIGERLSINGLVSSGVLDLKPYFDIDLEEVETPVETSQDRLFPDDPFDFSYLDIFDALFRLDNLELISSAGNVLVENMTIEMLRGSLTIASMKLQRDDTTVEGHFALDRHTQPVFETKLSIENIDLGTFLQDIRSRDIDEGRFDLALNLQSHGNSLGEVMGNLGGEVSAFLSEARIIDASLSFRSIDLLFGMLPWLKRREDVTVNCAMSHLDILDGIIDIKSLYLDAAQMRMVGRGTIDLRNELLDIRLAPRAKSSRILAHNIDLLVKGPMIEPKISTAGTGKAIAVEYGKYVLLGPLGLLVPTEWTRKHPCAGSLREYLEQQSDQN